MRSQVLHACWANELTVHGVTKSVNFALSSQLVDGTVVVVGSAPIVFGDFGVDVPNGGPVISVSDDGTLEFQLLLTR